MMKIFMKIFFVLALMQFLGPLRTHQYKFLKENVAYGKAACYSGTAVGMAAGDTLRVRSGPSKENSVTGNLKIGARFKVVGYELNGGTIEPDPNDTVDRSKAKNIWMEIEYQSGSGISKGWINYLYVECSEEKISFGAVDSGSGTSGGDAGATARGRIASLDGHWFLPVKGNILASDEDDHLARGSVNSWDLQGSYGEPIYAVGPGTVILTSCANEGGYGCWVKIRHPNGLETSYAHMISGSIAVKNGQNVTANTQLGQIGWTGTTSFGPHTHFVIVSGGTHHRIDRYFSRKAMNYKKFCCQSRP